MCITLVECNNCILGMRDDYIKSEDKVNIITHDLNDTNDLIGNLVI